MAEALTKALESGPHTAARSCPNCRRADVVQPFQINDLSPIVQYYRCGRCGYIWSTREKSLDEFLSSL